MPFFKRRLEEVVLLNIQRTGKIPRLQSQTKKIVTYLTSPEDVTMWRGAMEQQIYQQQFEPRRPPRRCSKIIWNDQDNHANEHTIAEYVRHTIAAYACQMFAVSCFVWNESDPWRLKKHPGSRRSRPSHRCNVWEGAIGGMPRAAWDS